MEKSKSIAGIVGPTLVVMVLSELNMWNPALYETQIVPLVYLSGVLLFIACISIVRSHNIWVWGIVFFTNIFYFCQVRQPLHRNPQ
jgi:hypothetical protein